MILRSIKPGDTLPKSTISPCLCWKEPAPDVEKTKEFVELAPARSWVDKRACRLAVVHESLLKWGFMHKVDDALSLFCNKKIRTYYVSSFKVIPEKWYFFALHGHEGKSKRETLLTRTTYLTTQLPGFWEFLTSISQSRPKKAPPWDKSKGIVQQALDPQSCQDWKKHPSHTTVLVRCKESRQQGTCSHQKISLGHWVCSV